ncbi:hypothetical protein COOONC_14621 [Cooperia oncophora]
MDYSEMDPVLQFDVGDDEPPEKITINCAQVILLTSFEKAKSDSYRLVRKLSRQEVMNVGKPGRKRPDQLRMIRTADINHRSPQTAFYEPSSKRASSENSFYKQVPKVQAKNIIILMPRATNQTQHYLEMYTPLQSNRVLHMPIANEYRVDELRSNLERSAASWNLEEFTWYDLDPEEIFYPSAITLKRLEESLKSSPKKPFIPRIRYDDQGNIVVRCPGQKNWSN